MAKIAEFWAKSRMTQLLTTRRTSSATVLQAGPADYAAQDPDRDGYIAAQIGWWSL